MPLKCTYLSVSCDARWFVLVLNLATVCASYLDPLDSIKKQKQQTSQLALNQLKKDLAQLKFEQGQQEWISCIFDQNMLSAIPQTVNKKTLKRQSTEQTHQFFT